MVFKAEAARAFPPSNGGKVSPEQKVFQDFV
jgi:hypothetical protein